MLSSLEAKETEGQKSRVTWPRSLEKAGPYLCCSFQPRCSPARPWVQSSGFLVLVEGRYWGSGGCALRVIPRCSHSSPDLIPSTVAGPSGDALGSTWLRECNHTSIGSQHKVHLLSSAKEHMVSQSHTRNCVPEKAAWRFPRRGVGGPCPSPLSALRGDHQPLPCFKLVL